MERDCLIGYGASNLIMERLMISSDAFTGVIYSETPSLSAVFTPSHVQQMCARAAACSATKGGVRGAEVAIKCRPSDCPTPANFSFRNCRV
jgi:DNA-directed RNA polymerase beta subunit